MTLLQRLQATAIFSASLWLVGCATPPPPKVDPADRPAERSLLHGLRAYDEAQYGESELALNEALRLKLTTAKDRATAYKTLAFIYCTSGRTAECSAAFRSARNADPTFVLSKAEAGHPVWGPVYEHSKY